MVLRSITNWRPVRRRKPRDYLSQAIYLFPIAASIIENLGTMDLVSLINTSQHIRQSILGSHLNHIRELVIVKDEYYHESFDVRDELIDSPTQRYRRNSGNYDPEDLFYIRFNEFSFDELILQKILGIAPTIHPTLDRPFPNSHRFLTTLVLDGTDVAATALFGSFSIGQGVQSLPIRLTPGLISYIAPNLVHLSLRHCVNINHSQVCVYLLIPPTQDTELKKLKRIFLFNSGENPANGPFHNRPGYGSHGKIARDADHILSIQLLRILFPVKLPIIFHHTVSIMNSVPAFVTRAFKDHMMPSLHDQLHTQYTSGWFSKANIFLDPMLTLVQPQTGVFVPGPWGGRLSKMHESLALYSICNYLDIEVDWTMCINRNKCHSWRVQQYQNVAAINNRTGRTEKLGYMNGINARDYAGPGQHWWSLGHGPLPRVPQNLLPPFMPIQSAHLKDTHPRPLYPPSAANKEKKPNAPEAAYFNIDGDLIVPLPGDPNRPVASAVFGLNFSGNHTHVAAGMCQRQMRGGKVCSNCGLWETENSSFALDNGAMHSNPGRPFPIGELCTLCVGNQTCLICDRELPDPNFLLGACQIHGNICSTCRDTGEVLTCVCGKFFCEQCLWDNCMVENWECCRVCNQWYCERCCKFQGNKEDGLHICAGADCMQYEGQFHMFRKHQGVCNSCIGGKCQRCHSPVCFNCFGNYQSEMKEQHGVEILGQNDPNVQWIHCTHCLEARISECNNVEERCEVMHDMGINPYVLERQQRLAKDWVANRGNLFSEFANFQREELEYFKRCLYGDVTIEDVQSADRKTQHAAISSQEGPVVLYEDRPHAALAHTASSNIARHTMERLLWMLDATSDLNPKEKSELMRNLRNMRDRLLEDEKNRILHAKEHRKAVSRAALGYPPNSNGSTQPQDDSEFRITESDAELDEFISDSDDYGDDDGGFPSIPKPQKRRKTYAVAGRMGAAAAAAGATVRGGARGGRGGSYPPSFDPSRRVSHPATATNRNRQTQRMVDRFMDQPRVDPRLAPRGGSQRGREQTHDSPDPIASTTSAVRGLNVQRSGARGGGRGGRSRGGGRGGRGSAPGSSASSSFSSNHGGQGGRSSAGSSFNSNMDTTE